MSKYKHTYIHIYTYIHTCTHTYIPIHSFTYSLTHLQMTGIKVTYRLYKDMTARKSHTYSIHICTFMCTYVDIPFIGYFKSQKRKFNLPSIYEMLPRLAFLEWTHSFSDGMLCCWTMERQLFAFMKGEWWNVRTDHKLSSIALERGRFVKCGWSKKVHLFIFFVSYQKSL